MPELTLKLGETVVQTYAFDKDAVSIGRSKDNDIVIETLSVSRNHARIRREGKRYFVHDLESANGTYVNGVRMSKSEVVEGDEIGIGKHRIVFSEKGVSEDDLVTVAYDADRTMLMDPEPVGVLLVMQGKQKNQEFVIDRYETIIGRGESCSVRLFDWFVSKRHAMIRREGKRFVLSDFGKLTGVQVNGQTIREPHGLMDGDDVKIGPVSLKFMIRAEQSTPAAEKIRPVEIEPIPIKTVDEECEIEQEMVALSSRLEDDAENPSEEAEPEVEGLVKVIDSSPIPDMEAFLSSDGVGEASAPQDEQSEWMSDVLSEEGEPVEMVESPGNGKHGAEMKPVEPEASVEVIEPPACPEEVSPEVKIWEKALANSSAVIRREAARKLKKLTGKDYDV